MNKASSLIRQRNEAIRNTFWQHASTKPLMRAYVATALQFAAVSASTIERMHDITTLAADQRAFRAQSKYKTFRGWIFRQEWDSYEG